MTPKEFTNKMREIFKDFDTEVAHSRADDLMCELLEELGFNEGIMVYSSQEKWYA